MRNFPRFVTLFWMLLCLPAWSNAPTVDAREKLAEAERELNLAEAASRRVAARLEALRNDPEATPEQIEAMEAYAEEVKVVVTIRKEALRDLKELAGEPVEAPDPEVTEGMEAFEEAVGEVPSAEEPESEEERLEREFEKSLEEFDALILAHNRKVEERMAARMAKADQAAGEQRSAAKEAEDLLRSMGVDPGTGSESGSEAAGAEPSDGKEGGGAEGEVAGTETGAEGGPEGVESGGAATGGGASERTPREDEDIVARQLREAAEKETDPELREKLWKEYEAYLDGRS